MKGQRIHHPQLPSEGLVRRLIRRIPTTPGRPQRMPRRSSPGRATSRKRRAIFTARCLPAGQERSPDQDRVASTTIFAVPPSLPIACCSPVRVTTSGTRSRPARAGAGGPVTRRAGPTVSVPGLGGSALTVTAGAVTDRGSGTRRHQANGRHGWPAVGRTSPPTSSPGPLPRSPHQPVSSRHSSGCSDFTWRWCVPVPVSDGRRSDSRCSAAVWSGRKSSA